MYNSLQVNAEWQFTNGFTGTFVFTWQNGNWKQNPAS